MNPQIRKLTFTDHHLAKALFQSFNEDDGVTESNLSSDEYIIDLLQRDSFHVIVTFDGEMFVGAMVGNVPARRLYAKTFGEPQGEATYVEYDYEIK
jgi:hypothetical protein